MNEIQEPTHEQAHEALDPQLLEILRCPACTGTFEPVQGAELVCSSCGLAYPVRGGVPILLVDEARRRDA